MPTVECYRDIGALGARLDEMEKAREEREAHLEKVRQERADRLDERLKSIEEKLGALAEDRNKIHGVIWALRVLFGGIGAAIVYVAGNGAPEWLKHLLR